MDEPNIQVPAITLPLSEFLEILWRCDDKVYIPANGAIHRTLLLYPNEAIFHLITGPKEVTVWRARDWALAYERYVREKEQAELRVAIWNLRQEIKDELCEIICLRMGRIGVEESIAENIIAAGNVALATAMGAKEDLCKKIEQLKNKQAL